MHPSLKRPIIFLSAVTVTTIGVIYHTHWKQESDKAIMHQGVIRDIEREKQRLAQLREKTTSE